MDKITRFVKNVTILIFVLALGLAYYEFSDRNATVVVVIDSQSNPIFGITSETFFYTFTIFFALINVLISTIVQLTKKFPLNRINWIPNQDFWFSSTERYIKLQQALVSWIYGFALIINALVIFLIVKIWMANRNTGGYLWEYQVAILLFLVGIIAWIGFLIYRLRLRREEYIV